MAKKKTLTQLRKEFADYYFDRDEANRVIRFFERELTHQLGDLAGQPFKLEQWQRYILRHFFGWKHRETGLRKYKVLYLEVPRKNGKSILAAGLGLYLTDADREPAARVVCFALNEEQAKEAVFDVAREMVYANAKLNKRIKPYTKTMVAMHSASRFQLLSGSKRGKHGKNLSAMIGDEVHEWENREVMDALRTSMVTRSQPVEIYLTTAGFDKNSLCYELHEYCMDIQEGELDDPTFFGKIYAADAEDDWTDPKTWAKANPNLGVSVRLDFLRDECAKAKRLPTYENTFKRLHLNIWTEQDTRWIPIEKWDACKAEIREDMLVGRDCYVGVDLSATQDMTAVVLLFPFFEIDEYIVKPFYFIPQDTLELRKTREKALYEKWIREGFLHTTPGGTTDYTFIEHKIITEWPLIYNIKKVSLDQWNATQTSVNLKNNGAPVEFWGQGFISMNSPCKKFSDLVIDKRIKHDGHPVLRFNVKNVQIQTDPAGNLKPAKDKSKGKIDGVIGILNALGRALLESRASIYDNSGIRTV